MIVVALCRTLKPLCETNSAALYLCAHLATKMADFLVLFDRWCNGLLKAARKRPQRAKAGAKAQTSKTAPRPKFTWPPGFAWPVKLVPETAIYGAQLQQLLADPEIAALVAEVPQAGKLLRPLCRMLGVKPIPQIRTRRYANPAAPAPDIAPRETAPLDIPPQEIFTVSTPVDPAQPGDGHKSTPQPKPLSPAEPAPTEPEFFLIPP